MSANWNIDDIIPGEKVVRRAVAAVVRFARFPQSDSYPSDHRGAAEMLDAALDPPELFPGQVGGVAVTGFRAQANDIIN